MLYAMLAAALIFVLVLAVPAKTHCMARLFRAQEVWAELMDRQNQATIYPKLEISSRLSFGSNNCSAPWVKQPSSRPLATSRGNTMSEAKKITIGVLGGVQGIAAFFALVMMLVGKGDGPVIRPQPILEQQTEPVPPAPARVQPQPLLAEQPPDPTQNSQLRRAHRASA